MNRELHVRIHGGPGRDSPGLPSETRFEARLYGLRSGRGCQDAIQGAGSIRDLKDQPLRSHASARWLKNFFGVTTPANIPK